MGTVIHFGFCRLVHTTTLCIECATVLSFAESEFGANIGQLLAQTFEQQQRRQLAGQGQQLQGINLLQGIGQQNIQPFLQLAALGINPDAFTQNPFISALGAIGGAAQGVASI